MSGRSSRTIGRLSRSPVAWVERSLTADVPRLGHVPALDGIRGWLVFPVLWTHYAYLEFAGALALDMFFALSGFLITTLLLEERSRFGRISIRQFYVRRGVRLLPELFVCLAFQVFLAIIGVFPFRTTIVEAFGAFFYVYILVGGLVTDSHELRMFHLWSLTLEEWYYLSWAPLMAGVFAKVKRASTVMWVVVGAGSLVLLAVRSSLWFRHGEQQVLELRPEELVFGAFVALGRRSMLARRAAGTSSPWERLLPYMMPGFVGAIVVEWWVEPARWIVRPIGMLLCCGGVLGTVMQRELRVITRATTPRVLVEQGMASYGIYIWHMVPFVLVNGETNYVAKDLRFPVWVQILVVTPIALGVGYCSNRFVSLPVRAWYKRRTKPVAVSATS